MAETLSTLSIISFVVAGVCLLVAVFLFVYFKIPAVIGDLSGRTARKSIAKMRVANEKTGAKSYSSSKTNVERGKLTNTVQGSASISNKIYAVEDERPETGVLADNTADSAASEETCVLENETTGFLDDEATGLLVDKNATAVLNTSEVPVATRSGKTLNMIESVMLIHTDEVI